MGYDLKIARTYDTGMKAHSIFLFCNLGGGKNPNMVFDLFTGKHHIVKKHGTCALEFQASTTFWKFYDKF